MKVSRELLLPCTASEAWSALGDPAVFSRVSKPFLRFRPVAPAAFPTQWTSGSSYVVKAFALGFLPLGTQEINPTMTEEGSRKTFEDKGRGLSGSLGLVSSFHHRMSVHPSGVGPTTLVDELEFEAGFLTPVFWLGFALFWWWRHRVMSALAPTWRTTAGTNWDARYSQKKFWSGKVNPALVEAAKDVSPGSALEVGCGEGADALWLAKLGFEVTAIDASPVALIRAEAHRKADVARDGQSREIHWIAQDALTDSFPTRPGKYDLVCAAFFHLPPPERSALWAKLIDEVATGGKLVIIGHSPEDAAKGLPGPPPELLFSAEDLTKAVPRNWASTIVTNYSRQKVTSQQAPIMVTDVVLVATR